MTTYHARLLIASVSIIGFACTAQAAPISKAVQQACKSDYRKFCSDYGLETAALRTCMDKAGELLSGECIQALIDAGEVSQAEVQRRAKASQSGHASQTDSTASIPSQPDSRSSLPPQRAGWRPPD
jgi:hypothetical protein